MLVEQAIICASGKGTRLRMGPKPYIVFKNRLLLDYCIEKVLEAGIKRIVVTIPSEEDEVALSAEKKKMFRYVSRKYKEVVFVKDNQTNFRSKPDFVRSFLNEKKSFYLLAGHSPQSPKFLRELAASYQPGSIVMSGYNYKYDKQFSIGSVQGDRVIICQTLNYIRPKAFHTSNGKIRVLSTPIILDFAFYDKFVKSNWERGKFERWPQLLIGTGGKVFWRENHLPAEIDYRKDLKILMKSLVSLSKNKDL